MSLDFNAPNDGSLLEDNHYDWSSQAYQLFIYRIGSYTIKLVRVPGKLLARHIVRSFTFLYLRSQQLTTLSSPSINLIILFGAP